VDLMIRKRTKLQNSLQFNVAEQE